jgi:hypothetical protein
MDTNFVDIEGKENRTRAITAYTERVETFYPKGRLKLIKFINQYDNFLLLIREKCDELLDEFYKEMGDDIRRMSPYWTQIEPTETIQMRRLQLVSFLECYVDFQPFTKEKCDELVDHFFGEMIANTHDTIFYNAFGDEYCGLDTVRDTDEELEATLRFFPCVMYLPRLTRNKMPLLVLQKYDEDDEEDGVWVCNTKAVSFLPVILSVAVELGVKNSLERGGLLSHTNDGITILDSLMMSGTESRNQKCQESIDEQFLQVLKQLRVLHLLRKEDIKKFCLLQRLCSQSYFAVKRFRFLVDWDPYALTEMYNDNRDLQSEQISIPLNLPIHCAARKSTIIGFRLVFDAAISYFPKKRGISLLFKKDHKNDWPLRIACDETRFGLVKSMEAIEASSRIYSSTVEAIIYAAIDVNIHFDCVYFILRMHPDIISRQKHSSMLQQ